MKWEHNLDIVNFKRKSQNKLVHCTSCLCADLSDDTVKCWGFGGSGQLGYGDTSNRGDEPNEMGDNLPTVDLGTAKKVKQIAVGSVHACAILNDDTVKFGVMELTGDLVMVMKIIEATNQMRWAITYL